MRNKRLLFVVNTPSFFVSHRLSIAKKAKEIGCEIHVASVKEYEASLQIKNEGFFFHEINFSRKGKNPISELKTFVSLYRLFGDIKPDLVHLITIKPYLYGGVSAKLAGVSSVVSAVAGLGVLFSSSDLKYKLLRAFLFPLYCLAFGHKNQKVIFQNKDDRDVLLNWGVVANEQPVMIRGSGVDLNLCPYVSEPEGIPVISFAARLLIDKGVEVFAEASRILKERNIESRFWLIGEPDPGNANTVIEAQLKQWESEGLVELFGFRKDIPDLFSQSNIVTLPSFYGEGLPKVLVEAAACGRAVITTDHPGCRDAIESDETGLLVPIKDSVALADAIEYLIKNPDIRSKMGAAGRNLSEKEYDMEKIVASHMEIYKGLLNAANLK
jgi:glycosyltransferase involved in cell wall biosynthesis